MPDYTVEIHTQDGNSYRVQVAPDTQVEELFHDVIDHLSLPRKDAEGEAISWALYDKDASRWLEEGRTVEECGVGEGHQLKLQRKAIAGVLHPPVLCPGIGNLGELYEYGDGI